jgi:hypothetical protein
VNKKEAMMDDPVKPIKLLKLLKLPELLKTVKAVKGINEVKSRGAFRRRPAILPGILALLVLLTASCVTGRGKGFWASFPETSAYWDYRIGAVQVTVDHVREEGIAAQLEVFAETLLAAGKTGARRNFKNRGNHIHIPLDLDIRVEQRSFLHGVELFNTVYMDCRIRDGDGGVVAGDYHYFVGKRSILSSKEQQRLLRRTLKKIIKAQRGHNWKMRFRKSDA